ncbi:hypothetical protein LTR56_012542 [Elasticomyces elasticus]|nr:hypothetical protein LTR56_012542 [Elasticomyces elasticus]KAK3666265.1 hypothetical protein LTR22_002929 [Elasticomyces elasticus]KAK4926861.1 hypothetical protein LTR49_006277 [Elasticomyces elasticus]KAK5763697.1 hypothetical protein LTS12_006254 [Elasticomyces elasticus]
MPAPVISVTLQPNWDRLPKAREHIAAFWPGFSMSGPADIGRVVLAAAAYLKAFEPHRDEWTEILRIEIAGPKQVHLNFVDLPGLIPPATLDPIHRMNTTTSEAMLSGYLYMPRTVVLAVIDAKREVELQKVTKSNLSELMEPERTIAVVTQPDRLEPCSIVEAAIFKTVKLSNAYTGLGWHVLRNLPHDDTDRSSQRRQRIEDRYFASSAWSQLRCRDLGILSLRFKLAHLLYGCLLPEIVSLLDEPPLDRPDLLQYAAHREVLMKRMRDLHFEISKTYEITQNMLKAGWQALAILGYERCYTPT